MRPKILAIAALLLPSAVQAAEAQRKSFGTLADGRSVEIVTLRNGKGVTARVMTLGATLQSLTVPDRNGVSDEITLGHDSVEPYVKAPRYFGVSVGRFANRIAKGKFILNGKVYQLATNNGPNHLHGGVEGFDKKLWSIVAIRSGPTAELVMRYHSPDAEEGYPGALDVTATYSLNEQNELTIIYSATTTKPTIINLTNHAYFNLAGHRSARSVLDQRLMLPASRYTPVDSTLIPTGQLASVQDTPFDFRTPIAIGARIHEAHEQLRFGKGYDHNWILDETSGSIKLAARLEDSVSGRVMEVLTTAPAIQFYSGNFLDGSEVGRSGRSYRQSDGLCLEPQTYPNAPNEPTFPSARLDPKQTYRNVIQLRFSTSASPTSH